VVVRPTSIYGKRESGLGRPPHKRAVATINSMGGPQGHDDSVEDAPRPNVDINVDAAGMNVRATLLAGRGLIACGGPKGHGDSLTVAAQKRLLRAQSWGVGEIGDSAAQSK